jgi:hypothetical protein
MFIFDHVHVCLDYAPYIAVGEVAALARRNVYQAAYTWNLP